MHAVILEVDADESVVEAAREYLNTKVAPQVREGGAKAGYWIALSKGGGVSVVVFDSEDQARQMASMLQVGQPPEPGAPEGVTVRSVDVGEVLASV